MRAPAGAPGIGRQAEAMRSGHWSLVLGLGAGLAGLAGLVGWWKQRGQGPHGPRDERAPGCGAPPVVGGQAGASPKPGVPPGPPEPPRGLTEPSLLIVARDEPELFQSLLQEVGDSPHLLVFRDERGADRRRHTQAVPDDRRQRDRRHPPRPEEDLRRRPYIFVRPLARRPQD